MDIIAEPLRTQDFAPFGDVLKAPKESGRSYFNGTLGNGRVQPLATLPLSATKMERHEFSSQSFVPLGVSRWFVIVAPKPANGGPDASNRAAFGTNGDQGDHLRADIWHLPLMALDRPAPLRDLHVPRRRRWRTRNSSVCSGPFTVSSRPKHRGDRTCQPTIAI
jgi:ureidoglycolate lyase